MDWIPIYLERFGRCMMQRRESADEIIEWTLLLPDGTTKRGNGSTNNATAMRNTIMLLEEHV